MTKLLDNRVDFDLRLLRVGGVLWGSGMLLASAGTVLVGFTIAKAARDWVNQLERSPSSMASDKLQQARGASNAAMQAWRDSRPAVNGASVSR